MQNVRRKFLIKITVMEVELNM